MEPPPCWSHGHCTRTQTAESNVPKPTVREAQMLLWPKQLNKLNSAYFALHTVAAQNDFMKWKFIILDSLYSSFMKGHFLMFTACL